jgi:antitoxin ParD1/3/4
MTDDRHQPKRQMETALKADIDLGLANMAAGRLQEFDAHRIVERGKKLSAERRLAALDTAITRGLADIDASRIHDADDVFAALEAEISALPAR